MEINDTIQRAADLIADADALLISAGAGMGVDSGLPDFRGNQGFWRAYPPYSKLGLNFNSVATAQWFRSDPAFAWGFYGHRLALYRTTVPHEGFAILRDWAEQMSGGYFVYTSNVDGQFQRAGFNSDRIEEVHGAIDWLQCTRDCGTGLFTADGIDVNVDETSMRAREPLPRCPACGALARPNILMFDDPDWDYSRAYPQEVRFNNWLEGVQSTRVVIVECGAGLALPTVRRLSEHVVDSHGATLVRINPREVAVPQGQLSVPTGAADGLRAIRNCMVAAVG
jgi:NAD-dependent SIR2 family protein deacetylase